MRLECPAHLAVAAAVVLADVDLHEPVAGRALVEQHAPVQGAGFRVQGSGFRVQGPGFRVQGPGSKKSPPALRPGSNRSLIHTGARQNPAACCTNQGNWKGRFNPVKVWGLGSRVYFWLPDGESWHVRSFLRLDAESPGLRFGVCPET